MLLCSQAFFNIEFPPYSNPSPLSYLSCNATGAPGWEWSPEGSTPIMNTGGQREGDARPVPTQIGYVSQGKCSRIDEWLELTIGLREPARAATRALDQDAIVHAKS
jgi:hypothetical protein